MISAEVRINGRLIGHLYAHNEGPSGSTLAAHAAERCRYFWEYVEIGTGKAPKTGYIDHNRVEGAPVLMSKLFAAVVA